MVVQAEDPYHFRSQFIYMKAWSGKQVFVKIPGPVAPYAIGINGFRIGSDPGSGVTSEYNITPFLNGQSNTLDLQADLSEGQNGPAAPETVSLLIRDAIHARDLVTETHPGTRENEILVRFHLFLKSYLEKRNEGRTIQITMTDPGNQLVYQATRELDAPLSFGQETEMIIDHSLKDPRFWLPGAPACYEVKLTVTEKHKESSESIFTPFAIRSGQVMDSLFIQNGDSVQLVFASRELATTLPLLPEKEIRAIIAGQGINAIRREIPLACCQEELLIRTGILVVNPSE
jgi:beta-galactosidase/evolved beta-galactosidase subunit alpha